MIKVVELLECKDPSLDVEKPLTTMDVAYMNNDLAESICEIISGSVPKTMRQHRNESDIQRKQEEDMLESDLGINENQLTLAENLAQKVRILLCLYLFVCYKCFL